MCVWCAACVCAVAVLLGQVRCGGPALFKKEDQHTKELYVRVGLAVDVPCNDEGGAAGQWRLNGMALDKGLSIQNTTLEDRGNYTCHSSKGSLIQTLSLKPGNPPSPLKVTCSSPGYPLTATCSWSEEPEPLLPTRYTATYGIGGCNAAGLCRGHVFQPCLPTSRQSCVLKITLFHQDPHVINVTATNPLGSSSTLFSFIVDDVVKPDPPVHVSVTPISARQLSVKWAPPPSWADPDNFPLKYMVRYYHGNSQSPRTLGPYESQSMVLKGLRPGTSYVVQVSAQDQLVGQWSDWSQPVSATVFSR